MSQNIDQNQWEKDQDHNEKMIGGQKFLEEIINQLREVDGFYQISQISVKDLTE